MKNTLLFLFIGLVVIFGIGLFLVQGIIEPCDPFHLTIDCDLSGWLGLLLGDMLMGIGLAVLFYYLSSKNDEKIEGVRKNVFKIILEQAEIRHKQETYVIQFLKNNFGSILLCMGIISTFSNSKDESKKILAQAKQDDLKHIVQKGRSVLGMAINLLDPMLVEMIEKTFDIVERDFKSDTSQDSNLDEVKLLIKQITDKLDKYEHSADIIS